MAASTIALGGGKGGVLLQTGTLDWNIVGRSKKNATNLSAKDLDCPTVLTRQTFNGKKVLFVATSSVACHSVAVDVAGQAYVWGRNEAGQIGNNSTVTVTTPMPITGGWGKAKIVSAAVGKSHTILIDENGKGWGTGRCSEGQLGVNLLTANVKSFKQMVFAAPTDKAVKLANVSCGENFTAVLDTEGKLYTCGLSEFGQLGNGETGEFFVTASKIAFANASKLVRRNVFVKKSLGDKEAFTLSDSNDIRLGSLDCGKNHTVAVEAARVGPSPSARVFSWGCGSYGCLGHKEQKDFFYPRLVEAFGGPVFNVNQPIEVQCGTTCTIVKTSQGHGYYWGKHRSVGEAQMYPMLLDFLIHNQHVVRLFSSGGMTVFLSTEEGKTISYGQGGYGELGYGVAEQKSSAAPKFVDTVDGLKLCSLACGYGHTLFVAQEDSDADKKAIAKLTAYDEVEFGEGAGGEGGGEEEDEEGKKPKAKKAKVSK
jgi:alpha-tubulin suppressor-like RCC1 family protein